MVCAALGLLFIALTHNQYETTEAMEEILLGQAEDVNLLAATLVEDIKNGEQQAEQIGKLIIQIESLQQQVVELQVQAEKPESQGVQVNGGNN